VGIRESPVEGVIVNAYALVCGVASGVRWRAPRMYAWSSMSPSIYLYVEIFERA
jgi:hypothetical protein